MAHRTQRGISGEIRNSGAVILLIDQKHDISGENKKFGVRLYTKLSVAHTLS